MPTVLTEILIGVLSAVAGSLVTSFLRWPSAIWFRLKAWYPPDHRALYTGWSVASPPNSGGPTIRVQLLCAPDRSLREQPIDVDKAVHLVEGQFPGMFPEGPAMALPEHGVHFVAGPERFRDGYVWVWKNGRVDLDVHLIPKLQGEEVSLSILDIVRPILKLSGVVESQDYKA